MCWTALFSLDLYFYHLLIVFDIYSMILILLIWVFQVIDVHLVVDPWTRESRGFGFVTMENADVADQCIKYLDRSVLEGRVITVEKVMFVPFLL